MYEMEKRGKKLRRINERKQNLSFFIAETIVIMWVSFALAAFIWAFIASFSTTRSIFSGNLFSEGLNFKGYRVVFVEYKIMRNFFNSLIYTTLACIGILLISAPGAYVISKYSFIGGTALRSFLAASTGLPSVMILVPVFMTIVRMNAANSMLTLIAVYIAAGVPVSLYYLTGFFATLPSTLQESAMIDGCSPIAAFWRIMFPLAKPGIISVTVFNFIAYWNEYIWALSLMSDPGKRTISIALQGITRAMTNQGNYPGMFAAVVIVLVPTIILFVFLSDYLLEDMTSGAIKG